MKHFSLKHSLIGVPVLAAAVIVGGAGIVSAHGLPNNLTDEQKQTLEQVRSLHEQGLDDEAQALAESAGIPLPKHGEGRGTMENLTDEQKQAMDQIHSLHEQGLDDEARALAESVGLPLPPEGDGFREMHGDMGDHQAVEAAVEANDYDAFVAATADAPFADQVDEAFFQKFVEAHSLREAGDMEGAKAIMDDLGITPPQGGHGPHGTPPAEPSQS